MNSRCDIELQLSNFENPLQIVVQKECRTSMRRLLQFVIWLVFIMAAMPIHAQIERFPAREGEAIELWRMTHDPLVRDHANYHNTQCWSPDGRYLCYVHYAASEKEYGAQSASEVHLFDMFMQKDILADRGDSPRWANKHNWLFYARFHPQDGPKSGKGAQVIWLDLDTGKKTRIAYGVSYFKETDCNDRWLYGQRIPNEGRREAVRIPIRENSQSEVLPGDWGVGYNSLNINPAHPMIVSCDHNSADYYYAAPGARDIPFVARHFFDHDLAGGGATVAFPMMDGSHFAWSGDGSYFLAGNGPVRGRKWNEPLPANIHFLANISMGDICPCGFSGRWLCGSTGGGRGPLRVVDTRSGDGWIATKTYSFLCFPGSRDNSGPYDIDAKGSPDGTKIAFISTYDLKDGQAAEIMEDFASDRIEVRSTNGFPAKGRLVNPAGFGGEVLSYQRKTPTGFEGITRGLYGTNAKARLNRGQTLTSFETMLIAEKDRKQGILPPKSIRSVVGDMDSPLTWQRSSDLYVAVVRLPDRPHLRRSAQGIDLIPGENHWEISGYHLFRENERITQEPLGPGKSMSLSEKGVYSAVTVEWSGLKSKRSLPLEIHTTSTLRILDKTPSDFSWTRDRYRVDGREVSAEEATRRSKAVREIVHLHDGVIHREWLQQGQVTKRHDLNVDGTPIRHLYYHNGRLVKREYFNRDRDHVSTELFDTEGFITESIRGRNHWWYEHGVPEKFENGSSLFMKEGKRWIKKRR
ncbi:hypothetical protein ACFL5Z_10850 [Planctomycetota bacterium]